MALRVPRGMCRNSIQAGHGRSQQPSLPVLSWWRCGAVAEGAVQALPLLLRLSPKVVAEAEEVPSFVVSSVQTNLRRPWPSPLVAEVQEEPRARQGRQAARGAKAAFRRLVLT